MAKPGQRRAQQKSGTSVRAEINVTPLVDVSLVLLIIFMVVALKLSRGMQPALPATIAEEDADLGQPIVAVMYNGSEYKKVYVNKTAIGKMDHPETMPKLREQLNLAWQEATIEEAVGKLTLKIDKRLKVKEVRPIIDFLNASQKIDPVTKSHLKGSGMGIEDLYFGTVAIKKGGQ